MAMIVSVARTKVIGFQTNCKSEIVKYVRLHVLKKKKNIQFGMTKDNAVLNFKSIVNQILLYLQ